MRFCLKWGVPLLTVKWTGWSVYHVYPFALKGINLLTAIEISKQKYKFIEYYYAVFLFFFFPFLFSLFSQLYVLTYVSIPCLKV